jgi:hypothetical protein
MRRGQPCSWCASDAWDSALAGWVWGEFKVAVRLARALWGQASALREKILQKVRYLWLVFPLEQYEGVV